MLLCGYSNINFMQVTFDLPDEVASQLRPFGDKLPQILKLGLQEFQAIDQDGFSGMAEVLEFLAGLPTAEEIIALRPSESLQSRISALLEKNRMEGLTSEEEQLWQGYEYIEHIVRMAKAKAFSKLKESREG
jgi:hypothetical protein